MDQILIEKQKSKVQLPTTADLNNSQIKLPNVKDLDNLSPNLDQSELDSEILETLKSIESLKTPDYPKPPEPENFNKGQLGLISIMAASEIFGDRFKLEDPNLFLESILFSENNPKYHSDKTFILMEIISKLLEKNKLKKPDGMVVQVYGRLSGRNNILSLTEELGWKEKNKTIWGTVISTHEFQFIKISKGPINIIFPGEISNIFEKDWPLIPKNKTMHTLTYRTNTNKYQNKTFVKSKKYISILVWLFWKDNPIL